MQLMLVGIFGILGVFCRYWIGFGPSKTFFINIVGSLLIGILYVLGVENGTIPENYRIALMAGLLGGFTTFSGFSLDTLRLFEEAKFASAALYFIGSPVAGLGAAFVGVIFTRLVCRQ